ncbi:MAG TPA: Plug domain-containing protein, partial [Rhodanobacter sp.]|nr:Plug domain-containing protein [Rhodanobacter sp.]
MRSKQASLTLGLMATAIAFALAAPAPVLAVQTTPAPQDAVPGNAQANPKTATNTATLPTIVVTATRRSESIQDVPGGVTALSGTFLDQIHANSFEQFAGFVPGLSFDSLGPTSDIIAIRGVTTGGTQLSSGIGMYLDQVPIGASTPFGVGFQTFPVN